MSSIRLTNRADNLVLRFLGFSFGDAPFVTIFILGRRFSNDVVCSFRLSFASDAYFPQFTLQWTTYHPFGAYNVLLSTSACSSSSISPFFTLLDDFCGSLCFTIATHFLVSLFCSAPAKIVDFDPTRLLTEFTCLVLATFSGFFLKREHCRVLPSHTEDREVRRKVRNGCTLGYCFLRPDRPFAAFRSHERISAGSRKSWLLIHAKITTLQS